MVSFVRAMFYVMIISGVKDRTVSTVENKI